MQPFCEAAIILIIWHCYHYFWHVHYLSILIHTRFNTLMSSIVNLFKTAFAISPIFSLGINCFLMIRWSYISAVKTCLGANGDYENEPTREASQFRSTVPHWTSVLHGGAVNLQTTEEKINYNQNTKICQCTHLIYVHYSLKYSSVSSIIPWYPQLSKY